jgi:hypothetical protein
MKAERQTGVNKTWKDDRAYGFLRTDDHRDILCPNGWKTKIHRRAIG